MVAREPGGGSQARGREQRAWEPRGGSPGHGAQAQATVQTRVAACGCCGGGGNGLSGASRERRRVNKGRGGAVCLSRSPATRGARQHSRHVSSAARRRQHTEGVEMTPEVMPERTSRETVRAAPAPGGGGSSDEPVASEPVAPRAAAGAGESAGGPGPSAPVLPAPCGELRLLREGRGVDRHARAQAASSRLDSEGAREQPRGEAVHLVRRPRVARRKGAAKA